MSWLRGRTRSERGAIAIMVALLATVLFGCAALAVDLGNAWSRKRAVQKQVDVSALAAGWMLPMTPANKQAIASKVAEYLDDTDNRAAGQASVTGAQLIDGVVDNGEVVFLHEDGSACSDQCTQMRVLAPKARVDFGFAAVLGMSHVDVQRVATVRVVSELPPQEKTIPFWLPTGCGFGPTQADTTQGGTTQPTATPTASPTAETRFEPAAGDVGGHVLSGAAITEVGYFGATTVSGYSVNGISGAGVKKVTLRAYPPTGTAYVDFAAQTTGNGVLPAFQVSQADLTKIPGDWWVWALAQKNNSFTYSSNHLVIRVTGGPSPTATATPTVADSGVPVGCIGQDRGNFGQLDDFARNGNNCIVGDTGNDGPKTYDGLVAGLGDGTPGRLDAVNGATTCPERSDLVMSGHLVNNDVLSCFLRNGATLADIAKPTGVSTSMIDPKVMQSPRFVWLPVVFAYDRAQKNFQPIRHFVAGFITDETQTSTATASNGLDIDGNSVKVLHVFTFNRDVLPTIEHSKTTDYDPTVGGAIVRLVG